MRHAYTGPAYRETELGDALLLLNDATVLRGLSAGARARCEEFSWSRKVARLYGSPAS